MGRKEMGGGYKPPSTRTTRRTWPRFLAGTSAESPDTCKVLPLCAGRGCNQGPPAGLGPPQPLEVGPMSSGLFTQSLDAQGIFSL